MRDALSNGYTAEISPAHDQLHVFSPDGQLAFSLAPPEFSMFYTFAEHFKYGNCPVVSFSSSHTHQGWPDWYCRVDVKSRSLQLINPWR